MPNDWNTALKSNIYYLLINFLNIKYDIRQIITQTFKIWFTIFNLLDVINVRVISGTFQKLGNIATNSLLARPILSSSCMRSNDKESQNLLSAFISRCVLNKIFLTLQMVNGEGCFREAFNRKKTKIYWSFTNTGGRGFLKKKHLQLKNDLYAPKHVKSE